MTARPELNSGIMAIPRPAYCSINNHIGVEVPRSPSPWQSETVTTIGRRFLTGEAPPRVR